MCSSRASSHCCRAAPLGNTRSGMKQEIINTKKKLFSRGESVPLKPTGRPSQPINKFFGQPYPVAAFDQTQNCTRCEATPHLNIRNPGTGNRCSNASQWIPTILITGHDIHPAPGHQNQQIIMQLKRFNFVIIILKFMPFSEGKYQFVFN